MNSSDLTALITGVSTFPASDGALKLFSILKPLGDLERYQFEDWRNNAVRFNKANCYSAVYCRPGEMYLVLVNLSSEPQTVKCAVNPQAARQPISAITKVELMNGNESTRLSGNLLTPDGQILSFPANGAMLIRLT